jgi:hypothetical protein
LSAIRNPPAIYTRVEVWRFGIRVDTYGDAGLPIYGGQVDVDPTKQVRRVLTGLKTDATDETWALLSPTGTEIRVFRGFKYLNGEVEAIPVGWFVVPDIEEEYGGDWSGQIGASDDRMSLVQRARFVTPRAIPAQGIISEVAQALLAEVLGEVTNLASSLALVTSPLLFERDRAAAVKTLLDSIGAEAIIAPDGTPIIRDIPTLEEEAVWTVDAGNNGVLYSATRSRSYRRTYSGVVAAGSQIDGSTPFDPVAQWDDDPLSPTYRYGPFGQVPYFFTSPLLATSEQARVAALALLPRVTAARAQMSLSAECNPALADGDTILVRLPKRQRGQQLIVERHMVGPFTVPLTTDGVQTIETASAVVEDSE